MYADYKKEYALGGVAAQADLLRQEGFVIDTNGKTPKVKQFKASLVRFDQEGQRE
ncbi:MAG: hypothetical protein ABIV47_19425 [Roseiflexaceae bacterium]